MKNEATKKRAFLPTLLTTNICIPNADNIYREFWCSLPVSPLDYQALVSSLSSLLGTD